MTIVTWLEHGTDHQDDEQSNEDVALPSGDEASGGDQRHPVSQA